MQELEAMPSEAEHTEDKKRIHRSFLGGMAAGMLVAALVICGVYLGRLFYQYRAVSKAGESGNASVLNAETLSKIKTIEDTINTYYYYEDKVSAEGLEEGIYKGMVEALGDPYSEYYSNEELEDVTNSNQGVSYGIGAYISIDQEMNRAMISGVMDGTPAQEAGLREGDIIYKVEGEATQGLSLTEVVSRVKGREGTTVHLTIYRKGEADYLEMDIVRSKQIETTTVDWGMVEDSEIGYIRIREFDEVTVDQYAEAMAELNEMEMKALILDLRSNPGGDLNAVVEVARKILPEGLILRVSDKEGNEKQYTCDGTKKLQIPLAVLVNGYSASASEILAGAIQDHEMGTLIGTTTYGKGIVQRIHRLDDGTAIKLTVSAYFTPSGRNIHGTGIEPDVVLEYDHDAYAETGSDNQVDKAVEILEKQLALDAAS